MTSINTVIAMEKFAALRQQEDLFYAYLDYLSPQHQALVSLEEIRSADAFALDGNERLLSSLPSESSAGELTEIWRERICDWCYQVVDHFDFSREVVAVAMSYLDRYLCARKVNKKLFQLAAMASLFIAIKLHEPSALKLTSLTGLSRGFFTPDHIIAMEQSILRTLKWRMNPPTVMTAVRLFLDLLATDISNQARLECTELSRFLSELSVCDYFFTTKKPSHVALACILTSFEGLSRDCVSRAHCQHFVDSAFRTSWIDCTVSEVLDCRLRLRELYDKGQYQRSTYERARGSGGQSPDNVARHVPYESNEGRGMITPSHNTMQLS
eukprot:CAMPEP_0176476442 /NCGR_PEP_ID=MMETSP0200_2-20121128/53_1 /TAXON_ID=947934 /ORGANISM="Chaetoceros sp., Strain GSL56" /LENGTH=325 /DNA_ID=CAMNT_0017872109 /DNA_START=115 /DNA_END=1092 /DNA_ORIENTATION=+